MPRRSRRPCAGRSATTRRLEVIGQGTKRADRPRRARPIPRSTSPAFPASRSTSRPNWCCRPRPARRSPRSRRCSRRTTRSSPSSRWITARCSAAKPGAARIGGAIAANLSGPRRIKAGAARDHFLGVTAVTGRGETIKSGGRVVKNVTGYDMCKLLAGSWGTLAAMTDVTIKVLPKAETEATVLSQASTTRARAPPWPRPWARPATSRRRRTCPITWSSLFRRLAEARRPLTALRLEGVAPSVAHRKAALAALMKPFGAGRAARRERLARALAQRARREAVRGRGGARAADSGASRPRPAEAHDIGRALITPAAQMFYDWAGGLIWAAMPFADEPMRRSIRARGQAASAAMPRWSARRPRCAPRSTCSSRRRRTRCAPCPSA